MVNTPTEKQLRLAKWITEELYMRDPGLGNMSRSEVAGFIEQYYDDFQKALDRRKKIAREYIASANRRDLVQHGWRHCRSEEFIGGDYGVGNNDMGIDCMDFGIFPWGES